MRCLLGICALSSLFAFEEIGSLVAYDYEEPLYLRARKEEETVQRNILGREGIVTASATPWVAGREWFMTTDLLYWHAHLDGTEYGARFSESNNNASYTTKNLTFRWDYGLRVGIGTVVKKERWDLFLDYTYIRPKAKGTAHAFTTTKIVPMRTAVLADLSATREFNAARSSLSLQYKNLNFEIGRNYFISSQLTLRPHFGVRSSWINELQKTYYDTSTLSDDTVINLSVYNSSNMWGIGPRLGMKGKWFLNDHLHFASNFAMSYLYSYFRLQNRQVEEVDDVKRSASFKSKMHRYVPVGDLFIGFGWGGYLHRGKRYLLLEAGYDLSYFWSQNQLLLNFPRETYERLWYESANQSLSLNGLTIKARLDF